MDAETSTRRSFLRSAGLASAGVLGVLALPVGRASAAAEVTRSAVADSIADQANAALRELISGGVDSGTYSQLLDEVATATANRLGADPSSFASAWANADQEHQLAILTGLTQLGVPYRRFKSDPGVGFDCSGITMYAWSGAGYALPHQSTAQIRQASPRTFETAQAGDLVQYPGHIMMWLGVDRSVLQSPRPGKLVEVVNFRFGRSVRVGDPTN